DRAGRSDRNACAELLAATRLIAFELRDDGADGLWVFEHFATAPGADLVGELARELLDFPPDDAPAPGAGASEQGHAQPDRREHEHAEEQKAENRGKDFHRCLWRRSKPCMAHVTLPALLNRQQLAQLGEELRPHFRRR